MHSFVTVVVPFSAACLQAVEQALNRIGNPAGPAVKDPLDAAEFVHFISITIVEVGGRSPPCLVIELTADDPIPQVFEHIESAIGQPLRDVLEAAEVSVGSAPLADFLSRHHQPVGQGWFSTPGVNYDGTPSMTVGRIRREAELAAAVSNFLDSLPAADSPLATLTRVRDWLWNDAAQKWAFVAEPTPILGPAPPLLSAVLPVLCSAVGVLLWPFLLSAAIAFILAWWAGGLATGIVLAVLLAVAAALVGTAGPFIVAAFVSLALCWFAGTFVNALWAANVLLIVEFGGAYAMLRRKETADVPEDIPPSAGLVEAIMTRENFGAQNHMAATSTLKSGWFRRMTLRLGLWVASQLAAHFSAPSFLGTTGVIHFARWIVLPGTNKLLFRSNFDGTWERYLEDFIEIAYQGVNGIWSNTVGFPRTRNLFVGGARDGDRLRRWTRRQQIPTPVWYSAYPTLTLGRIRTNAAIRQGVASAVTEADAADWLACFGSAPRPADVIQVPEVPTLIFGGLRRLRYGACILIRLDRANAKAWLAKIENDLSFGDYGAANSALLVGFSRSGLVRLGLEPHHLETFPVAFQHGSAAPWRAQALSDTGRNAPDKWLWGGPDHETDAILLVYARDEGSLDRLLDQRTAEIEAAHHAVLRRVRFAPLPEERGDPVREPFGFVDGISDPVIRGVGRWTLPEHRRQLVAPGEFVLGYPNNLGFVPASPSVAAGDDPQQILPGLGPDLSHPRPEFSTPQPTGQKDLGCNGTFLVVRHLEQDKVGFEKFLDDAAAALAGSNKAPSGDAVMVKEWVAAKMIGRWREDGSSLVRHPHRPRGYGAAAGRAAPPDNDFLYGVEDPNGLRCPFGAHIRRANPRESFTPSRPDPGATLPAIQAGANPFDSISVEAQLQLAITNRHRILRVGRGYRPQDDLDKPGLIFMCLNTDIERQFEFIQKTWVLGSSFHGLEAELDPLIGQHDGTDVLLTIPTPSGRLRLKGLHDFVTVRGSGYFFLPGRTAIRFLAQ
jgi:deferrochelatase/peroxidase EfeB